MAPAIRQQPGCRTGDEPKIVVWHAVWR